MRRVAIILSWLLVAAPLVEARAPSRGPVNRSAATAATQRLAAAATVRRFLLDELNGVRARHGLPPLVLSEPLNRAAVYHTQDMSARRYFSHQSPEGKSHSDRIRLTSPYTLVLGAAENLWMSEGRTWGDPGLLATTATQDLFDSPGHRVNMLDAEATHVGFGVVYGLTADGRPTTHVVQVFGQKLGELNPETMSVRLVSPLEFMFKSLDAPDRPFADPTEPGRMIIGWCPAQVRRGRLVPLASLPVGRYMVMGRRPGTEGWMELREIVWR